ncbi:MAG: SbcC/MukB-like Walker B domain-containing protein [Thermincola sp.]|nr:SbcC/MukB-like Walker B domain-containing protein [Thermincola sp.]MDT3703096.1 SbcC/MukB-like Walker B domain-containing protein [Thermincola sp.]
MKLLTRMLLINWHYIKFQCIDFSDINFLTGKNGSGKSTIIDALQLVLLGDTGGFYFNKAANDKSQRSLKGYLRGEVAEDEESNTVYLRDDDFSSYLVLEFHDQKSDQYFCLGVIFDCYGDGSHDHQFFYLNDKLPGSHFVDKGTELNRKGLKAFFFNNYAKSRYEFFETNSKYQEVALGKLGQINKKFFRLLKKAVPFSPIMDIKGFISEFVCDVENKIDISDMQENIRYYKQLEHEMEIVKKKIDLLKEIESLHKSYSEELQRLETQKYLIDRGMQEQLQNRAAKILEDIMRLREKIAATEESLRDKENELNSQQTERDRLFTEKINSDVYRKRAELERQIQDLEKERKHIERSRESLTGLVKSVWYTWREVDRWCQENLPEMPSLEEQMCYLADISEGSFELITEGNLWSVKENLQEYINRINDAYSMQKTELDTLQQELARLNEEIKNLRQGIKAFPPAIAELQNLIAEKLSTKHQRDIKPQIFADLLEIRSDKWRNAIEGYLNTQKFYLIIEPQYFTEALKVYDEFKFARKIYDVGIVDIEKIMARNPRAKANSLAEEVESTTPYARAYADYLLGQVIKCEKVEQLRDFRTSITPSCMLYQNYVARQMNPQRYETPYIGQKAVINQLKLKEAKLAAVSDKAAIWGQTVAKLAQLRNTGNINDDNINSILQHKEAVDRLPQVNTKLNEATGQLGTLDLSYLARVEEALEEAEQNIGIVNRQIRELEKSQGKYISERDEKEKALPVLEKSLKNQKEDIKNRYADQWVEAVGEPRFRQELSQRKEPENIVNTFSTTVKGTESRMDNKWKAMLDTRISYNRDFNGALDVNAPDNLTYDRELKALEDTLLVQYEEKIKDAQAKAQEQFKEDFISKLKKNIEDAREQIDDLNKALKDVPFGRDKYRFTVTPNPQYKKYYDMITDDMLMEGLTLFSGSFQEKYQDVVEELFRQIIDVDEGLLSADRREELSKNLDKFTDYRTYLDFDLAVTDDRGMESRLSRVIAKKSGGETQTPFYISVLASFVQLYRIKSKNQDNTVRILVFDEAYNKMDHQRIKESINLIRKLGLQVILSAPTEKIGDIAPLVDRNLCVTRIKNETIIKSFDPREIEGLGA